MDTKLQLAKAQAALQAQQGGAKDKSKKVLLACAAGQDSALVVGMFSAWADHIKRLKVEAEIRKEYEERIFYAENRLIDYREKQLSNVRGVLMRKAAESDGALA